MRPGGQPQAPVAEHPARPGGDGDEIERIETARIDGRGQVQFQDQFLRVRPQARRMEAMAFIQPACPGIVGCHQQAHPAATGYAAQPLQHRLQRGLAIATALLRLVQGEPAEPPAGRVPQLGVDDEETGQDAVDVDGDERMGRAAPDSLENVGHRAEESLDLYFVQLDRRQGAELGGFEPAVSEG